MEGGGDGSCDPGAEGRRTPPCGPIGMPSKVPIKPRKDSRSGEIPCEAFGE